MTNPIKTKRDWKQQRELAERDPGLFHGNVAKQELYWFLPKQQSWAKWTEGHWRGFSSKNASALTSIDFASDSLPWQKAFDDSKAPYFQWFKGGQTNACFNEVDAHVLAGHGQETAFIFESEEWLGDALHGGPKHSERISRSELLTRVVRYALALKEQGLKKGDRIVFYLPNSMEHIYLIEAAKRLGVIYTCVFGGLSAKTLAERVVDTQARFVISCNGFNKNGQLVDVQDTITEPTARDYVSAVKIKSLVLKLMQQLGLEDKVSRSLADLLLLHYEGELVVEKTDLINSLSTLMQGSVSPNLETRLRSILEEAPQFENGLGLKGIINLGLSSKLPLRQEGYFISLSSALDGADRLMSKALYLGSSLSPGEIERGQRLYQLLPPVPLPSDFPLFIAYTSGSTGKPKGIVHTHGGYVAGIAHTMKVSFAAEAGKDVIYPIADPGWITGQSYMISAPLVTRVTVVVSEGGPLYPHPTRFANLIQRYQVTIIKAGSTFLRSVAAEPSSVEELKKYDLSSLKVGSFCAEPVSPTIQQFAMDHLTKRYINSYWATEHGGMILTSFFGNEDFPLKADAHTLELPWLFAEVRIAEDEVQRSGQKSSFRFRNAQVGEKGEIVITKPYPYLARTIWGDAKNILGPHWCGDLERFSETYFERWSNKDGKVDWAYTRGDFACQYEDQSFTLHGRSDEVINTSGHRIGTEEIESAILKDKVLSKDSPVRNVIVVGAPDEERGQVPVAFILVQPGRSLNRADETRLSRLIEKEKGELAIPAGFISLTQFPETRSGKYMRRFLKSFLSDEKLGDVSMLRNPESLEEVEAAISSWQQSSPVVPMADTRSLTELSPGERREALLVSLSREVKDLLGLTTQEDLAPETALLSLGINSLSAVRLKNRIKQLLSVESSVSLPPNLVFICPTLNSLADYLENQIFSTEKTESHHEGFEQKIEREDDNIELTSDIEVKLTRPYQWHEPQNILLTGATGYLGSYLLEELLQKTKGKIYCLVRAKDTQTGKQRIQAAFRAQDIDQKVCDRVIAIPGDLSLPRLGIDSKLYSDLAQKIDFIFHAGALVNHVFPYSALKQANVLGTEEVLRFATTGPLKPVHNVSSIGVFLSPQYTGLFVGEWAFSESMNGLMDGYCKSKWAGEKLCRQALERGVPLSNSRPGHIAWHSRRGDFNDSDFVVNMIRLCVASGAVPNLDLTFDLAPIDYVVAAIVKVGLDPTSIGQNFSLTNPHLLRLPELAQLLEGLGHPLKSLSLTKWFAALNQSELAEDSFVVSLKNYYLDEKGQGIGQLSEGRPPHFGVHNTLRALDKSGIHCSPMTPEYLALLVNKLGLGKNIGQATA